jgi:hypothetical protein
VSFSNSGWERCRIRRPGPSPRVLLLLSIPPAAFAFEDRVGTTGFRQVTPAEAIWLHKLGHPEKEYRETPEESSHSAALSGSHGEDDRMDSNVSVRRRSAGQMTFRKA